MTTGTELIGGVGLVERLASLPADPLRTIAGRLDDLARLARAVLRERACLARKGERDRRARADAGLAAGGPREAP
jgi:hypothetical protein